MCAQSDMWSMGCAFYIILSNKMPFTEIVNNTTVPNNKMLKQQKTGPPPLPRENATRLLRNVTCVGHFVHMCDVVDDQQNDDIRTESTADNPGAVRAR